MKKVVPYIALAAVLAIPALSLHLQHEFLYAAVISVVLGAPLAKLSPTRRANAGARGIAVMLLVSAIVVRVYGIAWLPYMDVSVALLIFVVGAGIFRFRFGRWPYERHAHL